MFAPMRARREWLNLLWIAVVFFQRPVAVVAKQPPYEETSGKRGFHLFVHPARRNPADQLEYANQLRESGNTGGAMRQYVALTVYWPEATEAATATLEYARVLDRCGKVEKAFDEYQRLFDRYAGLFPYDEVLKRQFEIATHLMNTKKGRFLFMPGFAAPERAIPLFDKIATNAPQWDRAAEVQYLRGRAYELSMDPALAIGAYMTARNRYPDSPFADKAEFGAVRCYYKLATDSPNNEQFLESAWAAVTLFLNLRPQAPDRDKAEEYREDLLKRRAKIAYDRACYYDRIAHRPKAALLAYRDFVKLFPGSDWTAAAQTRIDALAKSVGDLDEK
jgi:outer membrane protein assembly factor BamD (BamD/ComL family)